MTRHKIKNAMIFAAGLGTRMQPLTLETPKPLAQILNKPLLEYKIDYFKKYGIEKIVINCFHLGEQIEEYISKRNDDSIIVVKEENLLDTGGGLVNALNYLGDQPIFVTNSDTIHVDKDISALESLENSWNNPSYKDEDSNMDMLMLLADKESAIGYNGKGDFNISDHNKLQWQQEKQEYIYTGLMILDTNVLNSYKNIDKFSLREIWIDNTSKNNGIINNSFGVIFNGMWLHIDSVEGIKKAELALKR